MAQRIVIDPITRIEGHLRVEAEIEDGFVVDEVVSAMLGAVMALVVMRTDNPAAYDALLREYAERLETGSHDL